ncbi:hypothetical protein NQ317_004809 [Molorchus minor]|uniref:Uncharacterized protein n=1 Tax=Molorchus minor TaxID=1323400 RepID=A0ABQ9JDS3_9CUCU|nr:hypothetical protein NQ317_004809 [Molorchus minor]
MFSDAVPMSKMMSFGKKVSSFISATMMPSMDFGRVGPCIDIKRKHGDYKVEDELQIQIGVCVDVVEDVCSIICYFITHHGIDDATYQPAGGKNDLHDGVKLAERMDNKNTVFGVPLLLCYLCRSVAKESLAFDIVQVDSRHFDIANNLASLINTQAYQNKATKYFLIIQPNLGEKKFSMLAVLASSKLRIAKKEYTRGIFESIFLLLNLLIKRNSKLDRFHLVNLNGIRERSEDAKFVKATQMAYLRPGSVDNRQGTGRNEIYIIHLAANFYDNLFG